MRPLSALHGFSRWRVPARQERPQGCEGPEQPAKCVPRQHLPGVFSGSHPPGRRRIHDLHWGARAPACSAIKVRLRFSFTRDPAIEYFDDRSRGGHAGGILPDSPVAAKIECDKSIGVTALAVSGNRLCNSPFIQEMSVASTPGICGFGRRHCRPPLTAGPFLRAGQNKARGTGPGLCFAQQVISGVGPWDGCLCDRSDRQILMARSVGSSVVGGAAWRWPWGHGSSGVSRSVRGT